MIDFAEVSLLCSDCFRFLVCSSCNQVNQLVSLSFVHCVFEVLEVRCEVVLILHLWDFERNPNEALIWRYTPASIQILDLDSSVILQWIQLKRAFQFAVRLQIFDVFFLPRKSRFEGCDFDAARNGARFGSSVRLLVWYEYGLSCIREPSGDWRAFDPRLVRVSASHHAVGNILNELRRMKWTPPSVLVVRVKRVGVERMDRGNEAEPSRCWLGRPRALLSLVAIHPVK